CVRGLQDGVTRVGRFGYSGGVIDIMVTPVLARASTRPVLRAALSAAERGEPAALVRVVEGPAELLGGALLIRPDGSYEGGLCGTTELDRSAADAAGALLDAGRTGTVVVPASGARRGSPRTPQGGDSSRLTGVPLFVEASQPPPRMIVFGAIDFAAALVRAGKFL